jgi:hypothetical protein
VAKAWQGSQARERLLLQHGAQNRIYFCATALAPLKGSFMVEKDDPAAAFASLDADAKPAPSRLSLYVPLALMALLCLGWSAFWVFAVEQAKVVAAGFLAREAERGREWVCPQQAVGGFPFRVQIRCEAPNVLIKEADGTARHITLAGLILHARILSPQNFIAVFQSPLRVDPGKGNAAELSWQSARTSFTAGASGPSELSVEVLEPVLTIASGADPLIARAKDVTLHLRKAPGDAPGTDLVALAREVVFSPLDQISGNKATMRFEVQASAPGLVPALTRPFFASVEDWRAKGGKARIVMLKAEKGSASLDLSGELGFDALHRLNGHLQGRAKGLDQLTGRLTQKSGLDLGGLLSRLGGAQGLPVSLIFEDGKMRYGPFPLLDLAPIY